MPKKSVKRYVLTGLATVYMYTGLKMLLFYGGTTKSGDIPGMVEDSLWMRGRDILEWQQLINESSAALSESVVKNNSYHNSNYIHQFPHAAHAVGKKSGATVNYMSYARGREDKAALERNTRLLGALAKDTVEHEPPIYIENLLNPCFSVFPAAEKIGRRLLAKNVQQKVRKAPVPVARRRPVFPAAKRKAKRQHYVYAGGDQPNFHGLPYLKAESVRCLPAVYISGFTKCGTTEIHAHIIQHQHVIGAVFKEPRFWDENRPANTQRRNITYITHNHETLSHVIENCYLNFDSSKCKGQFDSSNWDYDIHIDLDTLASDMQARYKSGKKCPLMGVDSSSTYISNGHMWETDPHNSGLLVPEFLAPQRLYHIQPHAKIIVMVRNPVDRLYSDYNFFVAAKANPINFHLLVANGITWWKKCVMSLPENRCAYGEVFTGTNMTDLPEGVFAWNKGRITNGAGRVRASIYTVYIENWLKLFPRSNLLVIRLEDYKINSVDILDNKVYPFMGLEPLSGPAKQAIESLKHQGQLNKKQYKRGSMLPKTREMLQAFYKPYNERLATLMGDDKYLWAS